MNVMSMESALCACRAEIRGSAAAAQGTTRKQGSVMGMDKTKKRICGWIFGVCFLSAYGVCGSLECQTIGNLCGDILLLTFLAVGTFAAYKGGYIWL